MFDFEKFERPQNANISANPVDIFNASPSLPKKPNDLWQGQSKALEEWYLNKEKNDVLVSLHTGAGKSLVGGLIAQSLVHAKKEKVLFVCATNDLIKQTSEELTSMLGLKHTIRAGGKYSNDLYEIGKGFCITNYQSVFNSHTVFRGENAPEAIIFDDAHVSEKIIRDCYTLSIERTKRKELFNSLIRLLYPYFDTINKGQFFKDIIEGNSIHKVMAAPPNAVSDLAKNNSFRDLFDKYDLMNSTDKFSYAHLSDNLSQCCMFVSSTSIEITPAFLPAKKMPFLADASIQRIYLSATLTSEVDFCRAFGRQPKVKISPTSDAGVGERLIVLVDKEKLDDVKGMPVRDSTLASLISREQKVLIATANYRTAKIYENIATPPSPSEFSIKLDAFRNKPTNDGCFVLVARVDGIDLPKDTCRVTLADSLPYGFSLSERYQFDFLNMRVSLASKLATRITQLFGRTNRGRNDYSVIFISDKKFINWLKRDRNLSLLPDLLQKQVLLGTSLTEQANIQDINKYVGLMTQVIGRDEGWLRYYADHIHGGQLDEDICDQAVEDDEIMTKAALAEAKYADCLWDGDYAGARQALSDVIDKVSVADRKLAGWYNIQIGHTYDLESDHDSAAKQYRIAKSRISQFLCLPTVSTKTSIFSEVTPNNRFHEKLIEIFGNDMTSQVPLLYKYKFRINELFDKTLSPNIHEEALRSLGELFGFEATRPEKDSDENSTLDVLWTSHEDNQSILFSLKTGKKRGNPINSEEVGQAHNHQHWFENDKKTFKSLGVVFVADNETVISNATPSSGMFTVTPTRIEIIAEEVLSALLMIASKSPADRLQEVDTFSTRAEWKIESIFNRVSPNPLA